MLEYVVIGALLLGALAVGFGIGCVLGKRQKPTHDPIESLAKNYAIRALRSANPEDWLGRSWEGSSHVETCKALSRAMALLPLVRAEQQWDKPEV